MNSSLPTPIPVGSPHVSHPPMFDATLRDPRRTHPSKQRHYSRRGIRCDIWLMDIQSNTVIRCSTTNISDDGLYGLSPIGYGMASGQRYEVRIATGAMLQSGRADLAPSLGYATVLRTELGLADQPVGWVGFALKFDVPQLIPV